MCQWYPLASRCVDIVLRDLAECVNGTHWPAGVLKLSKKILVCGYITGTTWSGTISDNILDASNEFIGFHKEVHSSDIIKRGWGWGLDYIYICII